MIVWRAASPNASMWTPCVALSGTRALLEELSARYRLGIVSNFYGNLEFLCEEIGYREILRHGHRLGTRWVCQSRTPAIFQAAVEKTRLSARAGDVCG